MSAISGNIVDLHKKVIYKGIVTLENGVIKSIQRDDTIQSSEFILPGFIDAHVHIESSMMVPSEFARLAVVHGTVGVVSDPHEIGNVLGIKGVRYMLENSEGVPFHFCFGAPSCVPATEFETAGAIIDKEDLRTLFLEDKLKYLSEMMNYPGVINQDPFILEKIQLAHELGKPIDGHAPGLRGREVEAYAKAGISTDHESFTLEEALDKIQCKMHILIREGSAAKNYEALHSLIGTHPDQVMFCSDDKHPDELVLSHINRLVKWSLDKGYDLWDVLRCACVNPIKQYGLDIGLLQEGESADFIVVDNLSDLNIHRTYIKGIQVSEKKETLIPSKKIKIINHFNATKIAPKDLSIRAKGEWLKVIQPLDGQLVTKSLSLKASIKDEYFITDTSRDLLKLVVINRYHDAPPALAFITNFGLKKGALASSIAHDSHNLIAVGVSDEEICDAINTIIAHKGGISVACEKDIDILPLPIAGIMSAEDGYEVANHYSILDKKAKALGTKLHAPFMTLSFMALLVIPSLKLSDKGLFDGESFCFVEPSLD